MKDPTNATRLHSLDALRGIAALAVVFWHWQHFSYSGTELVSGFDKQVQPFYDVFKIFYEYGMLAVDLFFSLSGFIFFWLYAEAITKRNLKPTQFFVLRLSRLYPLHFATLLLVAIGQTAYIALQGHSFVYPYQDSRHFALHIFLIPSLGFELGDSFNAPVWSVSIEVVLYAIFFCICWLRLNTSSLLLVASLFGFFVLMSYHEFLGRGVGSFFLGGLTYALFSKIINHNFSNVIARFTVAITAILWIGSIAFVYRSSPPPRDVLPPYLIQGRFSILILFPMTILSLALLEQRGEGRVKGLSFLGEISYSSYLLHFPLQLAFSLAAIAIGIDMSLFNTGGALILFFAILLPLSLASFRYLEMPAQQYLRLRWLAPRVPPAAAAEQLKR